jgi:hypothetical protein
MTFVQNDIQEQENAYSQIHKEYSSTKKTGREKNT